MPPYTVGQVIDLKAMFTDPETLQLFDPITVVFKVMGPHSSLVQTPAPVRDSLGHWHAEQTLDVPGDWWWRVETTGPLGAAERTFPVNTSVFVVD
jgi:hypothetical protein